MKKYFLGAFVISAILFLSAENNNIIKELTGSVKISAITKSYNGMLWVKYKVSLLAVWIEDENGKYINTAGLWGGKIRDKLFVWDSKKIKYDGVTGASRRVHGPIQVTWNLKDYEGKTVPPGEYKIFIEIMENTTGKSKISSLSIMLNSEAKIVKGHDEHFLKNFTAEYVP